MYVKSNGSWSYAFYIILTIKLLDKRHFILYNSTIIKSKEVTHMAQFIAVNKNNQDGFCFENDYYFTKWLNENKSNLNNYNFFEIGAYTLENINEIVMDDMTEE